MANQNDTKGQTWNYDEIDFDTIEMELQADIDQELEDLEFLKEKSDSIGNPDILGDMILNTVWEQFNNQIAVQVGEDFIKDNRQLMSRDKNIDRNAALSKEDIKNYRLNLSKDAHIQTTENFAKGKIASHNAIIDYQQRYDDWQANFLKDENGNIIMHDTRVIEKDANGNVIFDSDGKPKKKQVATITKDARKVYDDERNRRGLKGNKEKGTDMDETVSVAEIIRDPAANAHMTQEERIEFDLSEENLNEIDSSWNRSKGDTPTNEWLDNPNAKGQKPQEIFDNMTDDDMEKLRQKDAEARAEYEKQKKEGEKKSIEAGKKSRKEEAFRIGKSTAKAVVMNLLSELVKKVVKGFVSWLRTEGKKLKSLLVMLKDSIVSFVSDLKSTLITAGDTAATVIATSILGPVIGTVKKIWMFIKQGWSSLKEAIAYIKNPENRKKSTDIMVLEVGKIVMAGVTAAGAIVLSEVIEKGLMSIPIFAVEIPLLGSLANIIGIFMGGLVSGIIGALTLNLLDKLIKKKQQEKLTEERIDKGNVILRKQAELINVKQVHLCKTKYEVQENIQERHTMAEKIIKESLKNIYAPKEDNDDEFDDLFSKLAELNE